MGNNLARIHDTTETVDRIATIYMPSSTAAGAYGTYTSGAFGTLYLGRYGNYQVGLNWESSSAAFALAPNMTNGSATDLIAGTVYNLPSTSTVSVPAQGAIALYLSAQANPTVTLTGSTTAATYGTAVTFTATVKPPSGSTLPGTSISTTSAPTRRGSSTPAAQRRRGPTLSPWKRA